MAIVSLAPIRSIVNELMLHWCMFVSNYYYPHPGRNSTALTKRDTIEATMAEQKLTNFRVRLAITSR